MGMSHGDRVLETTAVTGTGNVTLLGAVTGYRAFSSIAAADGDMFPYVIAGSGEWEVGIGTRLSSTTFSRTIVTASSNAGAAVTFSVGAKEVWIDSTSAFLNALRAPNLILNAGMEVSQERGLVANTGIAATSPYGCDGFIVDVNGPTVTSQVVADAPPGFKYSLKASITGADAAPGANDYFDISQNIEGYRFARVGFGAAGASSISLGFWIKMNRPGTYGISLRNSAANRSFVTTFTVNAIGTWEYKTVTFIGDTSGTWLDTNGRGLILCITAMSGSAGMGAATGAWQALNLIGVTGQTNGAAAITDYMNITGVSVVPGTVPVSEAMSSLIVRPFDDELALCQRYWEKSLYYTDIPGAATVQGYELDYNNLTGWFASVRFKVRKRTTPTILIYNYSTGTVGQVRDDTAGTNLTASSSGIGDTGFITQATIAAVDHQIVWHWVADARL